MNELLEVYDIMGEITKSNSKIFKKQVLERHKDVEPFKKALYFLLNPFIVTGISTKKINKDVSVAPTVELKDIFDVVKYLEENKNGRDVDIANVQAFLNKINNDDIKTFVTRFVTKDLKIGVSASTVNSVYGKGTIPSFEVMLAESFDKKGDKIEGEFYITLKLDGNRIVAINDNNDIKFFTRSGQEVDGLTELKGIVEKVIPNNHILDGEIILKNDKNLTSDKLFRETQKVMRKDGEKKDLEFHVFDSITLAEFKKGVSNDGYSKRRESVEALFEDSELDENSLVKLLPVLYKGSDKSVIPTLLEEVEQDGFEGLMVNDAKGKYVTKRTVSLQKVKTMTSIDLQVVSVEIAQDGEFKGLMGRVNVAYKDGTTVGVGSGWSLGQREVFAHRPDDIIGKIIEVSHFGESSDQNGIVSLRFPVFKAIRDDKEEADV